MPRLTKIYTRSGDDGTTSLVSGQRVRKDSLRIEACGTVDELNSALGVARALGLDRATDEVVAGVQNELFNLGAELAGAPGFVQAGQIEALERLMDRCNETLGALQEFILPAGVPPAAQLHLARTICRRAERHCVRLAGEEPVSPLVIAYLNRLGDALFVLARWVNYRAGQADSLWQKPVRPRRGVRRSERSAR